MKPSRIAAVVAKESREVARDPITVVICLNLPVILLLLFGYAINLDVDNVGFGVLDLDQTPISRRLTEAFVQSGHFELSRSFTSDKELEAAMQRGEIKMGLVIPPDFDSKLLRQKIAPVQVLIDGTHSMTSMTVANYAQQIVGRFGGADVSNFAVETRVWYNPSLRSINYFVPGLYGVILMAFPPMLTALAIVREKETGSVQQIFASPLTSAEFIGGKLIPYGLITFAQMLTVIAMGYFWFEVPFAGSLPMLLAVSLIYVLCTVGIGLLISTVTQSQLAAMLSAYMVTLMPSFLFSGFLFPIFAMPYLLQLYSYIFPTGYFIEISRGIVLKGAGLEALWVNVALLTAYTLAIFLFAVWRLKKKVG